MPITPTYPGVYVEEIPSGVRTITGVATSITAFVGRAARGEVDEPVTINNFGDFERVFGGLNSTYPMSYAVRDFYLNGGSQAIVVRLFVSGLDRLERAAQEVADAAENSTGDTPAAVAQDARETADGFDEEPQKRAADVVATAAEDAAAEDGATIDDVKEAAKAAVDVAADAARVFDGTAKLTLGDGFKLEAASPGRWGNRLKVRVNNDGIDSDVADRYGLNVGDLFNLAVVEDRPEGLQEIIRNVSVKEDSGSRRVDRVLVQQSHLVRIQRRANGDPDLPNQRPAIAPSANGAAGADGFSTPFVVGANSGPLTGEGDYTGSEANKTGLFALEKADLFNLLCIPPDDRNGDVPDGVYPKAMEYCRRRRAMLIVDPPSEWTSASDITNNQNQKLTALGLSGPNARNAALYFPRVLKADPLREGQTDTFAPSGIIAGVMSSTDVQRGVWKAPAGIDAALNGIQGLEVGLTDDENGMLNPLGINCLRSFPVIGSVVWGARTLRGADQLADDYKYVPVRRLALYIEESLFRGLKWVVFEPNDEPLWAQIRLNVGAFMQNHFRQGAFQGQTRQEAYFVKCDKETTTQNDRNQGIVNVMVGFAPLKPAEFVMLKIQQMAGQIDI